MKLYLVRHGETELNLKKVYYGSTDCALTEKGEAQGASLSVFFGDLDLDCAIVSPLLRAKRTAALVLGQNPVQTIVDQRIREINFGQWEGKSWQQLQGDPLYETWCREWQSTRPPQGESFEDMAGRIKSFYDELLQRREQEILIVSHHGVLQQLMALLLQGTAEACWHYAFTQGTYSVIEVNEGFGILKAHNVPALSQN